MGLRMGTQRCVGCGKQIDSGEKTIRVAAGKSTDDTFTEQKEWGRLHEQCFEGAIDSPTIALAKIRKLSKIVVLSPATPRKKAKNAGPKTENPD